MTAESEFLDFMEAVYPDPVDREDRFADLLMAEAARCAMDILAPVPGRPRRTYPRAKARRPLVEVQLPDQLERFPPD